MIGISTHLPYPSLRQTTWTDKGTETEYQEELTTSVGQKDGLTLFIEFSFQGMVDLRDPLNSPLTRLIFNSIFLGFSLYIVITNLHRDS